MSPIQVAAIRGIVTAVGTGVLAALAMWTQTESVKQIAIAGLVPFLTILVARFGVEGAVDTAKE